MDTSLKGNITLHSVVFILSAIFGIASFFVTAWLSMIVTSIWLMLIALYLRQGYQK